MKVISCFSVVFTSLRPTCTCDVPHARVCSLKKKRKRETILVKYGAKLQSEISARFGGCPQHIYKSPHPFFCVFFFPRMSRTNLAVSALIAVTQKGLTAQKAKSVQRPISCARQLRNWEDSMQIQMVFDAVGCVYRQV